MLDLDYNVAMDSHVINETIVNDLHQVIGDDAMQDFLHRFYEDCQSRTARITEAYKAAKFTEVELEAHTLGSSAATYGAQQLEEICREIEFAKPRKDHVFKGRIDRLNTLAEQSIRALQDYFSR